MLTAGCYRTHTQAEEETMSLRNLSLCLIKGQKEKSLISVLYLESFLGGLVWGGGRGEDKRVLILGEDNRYFLIVPLVNVSNVINQIIIYTLYTSTIFN